MKRKQRRFPYIMMLVVAGLLVFAFWLSRGNRAETLFDRAKALLNRSDTSQKGYNAKSLLAVDLSDGEVFVEKNPDDVLMPASLAKLFVIAFANSVVDLNECVLPSEGALALVKEGSSVADIQEQEYSVENLYAAMLVPSGNDAAYVLADYVGGRLDPEAVTAEEKQESFQKALALYLSEQGYQATEIHDPSGYDYESTTTTRDLQKVVADLLQYEWFRKIVAQAEYTATLPDGTTQTWKNTNVYLETSNKEYYRSGVKGVKTGSLGDDYNLVVLYEKNGKEFLIISLGSESNLSRYDDVNYVLNSIDESYYLFHK
uniref:D-alanyl-D-alanine carboxypeptidase family protein n=1 Tax=Ndongobacter massiliensis TaxID=1871025 RepID=UPI000931B032|nr:serine hydrolase [Ndongobacter massiliensis]